MVTIQLVPYTEIETLSSVGKIRKLLNIAKQNKIVLLQGRLKKDEEIELIKATMEEVNKEFQGIELAVIDPNVNMNMGFMQKFKNNFANALLGDRSGLTVIGPASVVKQVKKDPNKIELLMKKERKKRKKR